MRKWQNRFTVLFLLLLASFSLLHLFIGCFRLIVPKIGFLYLALLCLFLWISACIPHGILIGMPFSAALLYFVYRTYSADLFQELYDFLDRISDTYYYHFYLSDSIQAFSSSVDSHLVIVTLLMFIISALIASSLTAVTWRIPLCLLSTVPLFAFCIAVEGSPHPVPILSLVLFWLLLFVTGNGFLKEGKSGIILFISIPFCLLLLLILFSLFNPTRYQYTGQDASVSLYLSQMENKVIDWITKRTSFFTFSTPDHYSENETGVAEIAVKQLRTGWGIIGQPLDMTLPYDSSSSDETVFQIKSSLGGMIYLRGNSYGEYNGTSWQIAENHTPSSLSFGASVLSQFPESDYCSFEIDSEYVYSYLFLPYYSFAPSNLDSYVASSGSNYYRGTFYDPFYSFSSVIAGIPISEDETAYREYAHSYYTKLPESTRSAVQLICEENGLYRGNQNIIAQVSSFVRDSGRYNLDTVPYPDNDYAVYFLSNAHEGYCIHFATAAVVIYRSLGIPARLTEGFAVNCTDNTYTRVTGANAHAWAEVYLDGFGWIPIEVTSSSEHDDHADTVTAAVSDPVQDPDSDIIPDSSAYATEEIPVPSAAEEYQVPSSEKPQSNSIPSSPETVPVTFRKPLSSFFIIFLIFLSLFLLFILQYHIRLFLYTAIYRRSSNRKKAVFLWARSKRITMLGIPIPQEIQICAERARFSRHEITDTDIREAEFRYSEQLHTAFHSVSFPQKIVFKYVYGIGGRLP